MRAATIGVLVLLAGVASADPAGERTALVARVSALLTAYAANDRAAVLALVDARELTVYGSDASELVHDVAGFTQMMDDDHKLWGPSVRFGELGAVDVRITRELATAIFQVPFVIGDRPPITVRLTTVWRKRDGRWLLTQCSNTVPTVGWSARTLLTKPAR